ncbi:peptidyl-prolyl cis-trans isomerase [Parasphingorhabdus sp.]|uniref:peptidyl-prolyl cis-trans isomerase n=1 Tax=Parasphingorhabdus sp. TaxID=2709688 RepID=UPI003265AF45
MAQTSRLTKLLKEPLVHFLAGALLVFGFFWATGSNRDPADYAISIDETDIARLQARWVQNFRRNPTQAELDGLIEQEITEEIYYREALRLGLEYNDPVVRRRLATKMRFLNNADSGSNPPTDAELQKWMDAHPEKYAAAATYDFEQIYLGQGDQLTAERINNIRHDLNAGRADAQTVGKPLSLPGRVRNGSVPGITRQFGEQFSSALTGLETGLWSGPVSSGFGVHLVKISTVVPGKSPSLNDVRQAVLNDWRANKIALQEKEALNSYRSQYDIRIAGQE